MNTHSTASRKDTLLDQLLTKNVNDMGICCYSCITCFVSY